MKLITTTLGRQLRCNLILYIVYLCAPYLNTILSAFYSGYLGELFIDLIETRYDVRCVAHLYDRY